MPTVLVVDDEVLSRNLLANALEADYRILFAASGLEAMEVAAREEPDLILLDIIMPDVNGYEVCTSLKANPVLRSIPIIFITIMSESDSEFHGLEIGGSDYITKPYNQAIVRQRVKNQLLLKQQRDQLQRQAESLTLANAALTVEIEERKRIEEQMAQVIAELRESNATVKSLSGLLPICSCCKKIRDDSGYWQQIESFLEKNSSLEFSHGLCTECAQKLYPQKYLNSER